MEKEKFLDNLVSNWSTVVEEYSTIKRTTPLYGFEEVPQRTMDWRAVTLWWNYKELSPIQKRMPKTTELVREGPSHRATGWLILNPHSRTDEHNHKEWGHKIIVHIPTYIPEGDVGFVVDGELYRWKMGEIFAFDCFSNHYGYNNTDEARSIMVLDFDYDEWIDVLRPYMRLEKQ